MERRLFAERSTVRTAMAVKATFASDPVDDGEGFDAFLGHPKQETGTVTVAYLKPPLPGTPQFVKEPGCKDSLSQVCHRNLHKGELQGSAQ